MYTKKMYELLNTNISNRIYKEDISFPTLYSISSTTSTTSTTSEAGSKAGNNSN